jgi:hypothetical protein
MLYTFLFFILGSDWALSEAKHNLVNKYLGALKFVKLINLLLNLI